MSASTMRATVRLGDAAIAQLRAAEGEMRAERERRAEDGIAAKSAEFARMEVAHVDDFARYAARCEALHGTLSHAELAREQTAIVDDARRGDRSAAAERIHRLERRADLAHATVVSQRLVTDEIFARAGATFVGKARDHNTVKGRLSLDKDRHMPMAVVSTPAKEGSGPTEHEVVFENAAGNIPDCPTQEEAVRKLARAAGPEVELDDPRGATAQRPRRKRKKAKSTQATKTRRAG